MHCWCQVFTNLPTDAMVSVGCGSPLSVSHHRKPDLLRAHITEYPFGRLRFIRNASFSSPRNRTSYKAANAATPVTRWGVEPLFRRYIQPTCVLRLANHLSNIVCLNITDVLRVSRDYLISTSAISTITSPALSNAVISFFSASASARVGYTTIASKSTE